MDTRSHVIAVAVDARDPDRLAAFWCEALGSSVIRRWTDAHGTPYVEVGLGAGSDAVLLLQRVAESKAGKNRVHLDVAPVSQDRDEEVERLVALGASVLDEAEGNPWTVLADLEGNEFCVLPPR